MVGSFVQSLLLVTFLVSGLAKIFAFREFKSTIIQLEIQERYVNSLASSIVLLEVAASILLAFSATQWAAYWLILFLLGCFAWSIHRAYRRQLQVHCSCFGRISAESFGWSTVVRVALLLVLVTYLLLMGIRTDWFDASGEELGNALLGSIGSLLLFSLLPYAIHGSIQGYKK